MAIERRGRVHVPVCDMCGDELPQEEDWEDARLAMKEAHWKNVKIGENMWENWCDKCQRQRRDYNG